MKTINLAICLLSSVIMATPLLDKRYVVTSVVLETQTVTVTASGGWWNWGRPSNTPSVSNTISIVSPSPVSSSTTSATSTSSASSSTTSEAAISSTAAASTTSSVGQPTSSLSTYAQPILDQHNLHRNNHSAPPLVWDVRLASIAQEIASSCQYAHNIKAGGGGYGQNIGAGAPPDEINKMITNQMYNDEMMFYPGYGAEPDMRNFEKWGHFSQIVWKATTGVGCYTQDCSNGLAGVSSNVSPYFTVCNYAGVGNFAGEYAANVLKPLGDAPVFL